MPSLEMAYLCSSNTEQNAEDLYVRSPLGEHRIQTGSALLDPGEMKTGRITDRLYEIGVSRIGIGPRNRRVFADCKSRNRISKFIAQIGIATTAAIASPEIGVDGELG